MQVYVGDEYVGDLTVRPDMIRNDRIVMVWQELAVLAPGLMWDSDFRELSPARRHELVLPTKERRISIDYSAIALNGPDYIARALAEVNAPITDCVESRNLLLDTVTYSWRVISIDSETHERLFDQDGFTPADSEPDVDYTHSITWNTGLSVRR